MDSKGFFDKYHVFKLNGDTDPDADYFVLRLDKDPHARIAAYHYALSIRESNPNLAFDLQIKIQKYDKEHKNDNTGNNKEGNNSQK